MTHPADKIEPPKPYKFTGTIDGRTFDIPGVPPLFSEEQLRAAMRQAYDADRPRWKDAPDAPGLWVCQEPYGDLSVYSLIKRNFPLPDTWRDGYRYFGPIPEDKK